MENKFKSIFDDITDLEFEQMLKECGIEYKKVKPGEGRLFIDGKRITVEDMKTVSLFNENNKII